MVSAGTTWEDCVPTEAHPSVVGLCLVTGLSRWHRPALFRMVICPFPRIMGASCPAGLLWDWVGRGGGHRATRAAGSQDACPTPQTARR